MFMEKRFATGAAHAEPKHAFSFAKAAQGRALKGQNGGALVGEVRSSLLNFSGTGESRWNRLQLRCGIASDQTHTTPVNAWTKPIGVASGEGEGRGG